VSALERYTPAAVDALRAGLVVLLPTSALDEAPAHRYGPLAGLEDHFRGHHPGGPVLATSLPAIGFVAVFCPHVHDAAGGSPDVMLDRVRRVNMHGPTSEAAAAFLDEAEHRGDDLHVLTNGVGVPAGDLQPTPPAVPVAPPAGAAASAGGDADTDHAREGE
jgi:hypothetical protein